MQRSVVSGDRCTCAPRVQKNNTNKTQTATELFTVTVTSSSHPFDPPSSGFVDLGASYHLQSSRAIRPDDALYQYVNVTLTAPKWHSNGTLSRFQRRPNGPLTAL